MASTLRALGTRRAWVVRGEEGLDEVSPCGPTRVTELDGDVLRERVITPHDFGLAPIDIDALRGGDAQHNARELADHFAWRAAPGANGNRAQCGGRCRGRSRDRTEGGHGRSRTRAVNGQAHGQARTVESGRVPRASKLMGLLDEILAHKRGEIEILKDSPRFGRPATLARPQRSPGASPAQGAPLRLIAEIKFRSPSAGRLSRA